MRTDKELRKLAIEISENRVFGSWQIDNVRDVPMVFMLLALMKQEQIDELKKENPFQFYEYHSKALPRCINGMPMFISFHTLTKEEWEKLVPIVNDLLDKKKEFIEKGNEGKE